jgi:hypothetical protein
VPDESQGWVTVGLDDHAVSPGSLDANADKLEAGRPDLGTLFDDAINPVCRRSKTAGKCTAS